MSKTVTRSPSSKRDVKIAPIPKYDCGVPVLHRSHLLPMTPLKSTVRPLNKCVCVASPCILSHLESIMHKIPLDYDLAPHPSPLTHVTDPPSYPPYAHPTASHYSRRTSTVVILISSRTQMTSRIIMLITTHLPVCPSYNRAPVSTTRV